MQTEHIVNSEIINLEKAPVSILILLHYYVSETRENEDRNRTKYSEYDCCMNDTSLQEYIARY